MVLKKIQFLWKKIIMVTKFELSSLMTKIKMGPTQALYDPFNDTILKKTSK